MILSRVLGRRAGSALSSTRGLRGSALEQTSPHAQTGEASSSELCSEVSAAVRGQLSEGSAGRLFAVLYIAGRNYKVTPEDIILLEGNQQFKVSMVGARDFSLFGTPLLPPSLATVEATVLEKTFSATLPRHFFVRTKNIRIHHWIRKPQNFLRINSVTLNPDLILD